MEIDRMFLLDTNPIIKILIFEEQKMWVHEIFPREKNRRIPHAFPSVVGTTVQVS